ncbi:MAG: hypothetical protein ACK5V7_10710, partial [bacterium]
MHPPIPWNRRRRTAPLACSLLALLFLTWSLGAFAQVAERVIHTAPSRFSDLLVVSEDSDGLRSLRFEMYGARQSVVKPGDPDHLELAYARAI